MLCNRNTGLSSQLHLGLQQLPSGRLYYVYRYWSKLAVWPLIPNCDQCYDPNCFQSTQTHSSVLCFAYNQTGMSAGECPKTSSLLVKIKCRPICKFVPHICTHVMVSMVSKAIQFSSAVLLCIKSSHIGCSRYLKQHVTLHVYYW